MIQNIKFIYYSIIGFTSGCLVFLIFMFLIKDRLPNDVGTQKDAPTESSKNTSNIIISERKIPDLDDKSNAKQNVIKIFEEEPIEEEEIEEEIDMATVIANEAFSQSDIADKETMVYMDIGNYDVDVGSEFEISVNAAAPALANFSLMLEFDNNFIEYVEDSAKAVGNTFRYGIEFYAQNDKGRMILISSGHPGAKHTEKVVDKPITVFRMKAKKTGTTQLTFADKGMIMLDPFGRKMEYDMLGGEIEIR